MQCRIGFAKLRNAIHIGANQIFHSHIAVAAAIAQGPAGNGTNMLLKLANIAAVLGPMCLWVTVHTRLWQCSTTCRDVRLRVMGLM